MRLSEIGKMADECMGQMETLHNDITVPLYQIMPNHIHLIVIVETSVDERSIVTPFVETPYYDISTGQTGATDKTYKSTDLNKNEKMQQIANYCGRLPHVISRFKSAVTKFSNVNQIPFGWQTRFHDRIVCDQDKLNRIAEYIETNVAQWRFDELNIEENQND